MPTVMELDLPHLAMEEPAFAADPLPRFDAARRQHPWLASSTFGPVITEYAAIKELLSLDDRLETPNKGMIELMGAQGTAWGRFVEEQILAHSGDAHRRIRDVLAPMFTPRAANQHRALMRQVVSELLDEWAPRGAFDFAEFASHFPITVMCSLIGASPAVLPALKTSLEALGQAFGLDRDLLPALEQGMVTMEGFVRELVADRRRGIRLREQPDLLDALVAANDAGALSDAELSDLLIFLFVAGYDTSKNVLTLTMHLLLELPDEYARCAADRAYCGKAVEETLRYRSPVTTARIAAEDIVYRDVVFPKGAMIFFPLSIAGRDPSAVADPDDFKPDRLNENRHMAFGRGMHICLGQFIARAQIEEGLHLITRRLGAPRLAGPVTWRPFPGAWGIRSLPIEFDPLAVGLAQPVTEVAIQA